MKIKNSNGMKNLFKIVSVSTLTFFTPLLAFAQGQNIGTGVNFVNPPGASCSQISSAIGSILCTIQSLLNSIVPILMALGVVYFVWGVVQYVIADGEEAKTKGRDRIIFGIIGMTVIIGFWGLVSLVVNTFGFGEPSLIPITTVTAGGDACELEANPQFSDILKYITCTINNSVIPFIFAIAVVMFIWGAVKFFIINSDEEAKREQGRQFMIWGIIALTVMLSIWGLVAILGDTFNLGGTVLPQVRP